MAPRGAFGDMFGALGALFSGLAFAGLIVTMLQQREDLLNQKDEIKLQRKDLEAQTEALRLQKEEIAQTNKELQLQRDEMQEQNRTIMLQRFENTFFSMLEMQQKIVEGFVYTIKNHDGNGNTKRTDYSGKVAFKELYRRIINSEMNESYRKNNDDKKGSIERCLAVYCEYLKDGKLDHYFQHLYRIVRFVDDYDSYLLNVKGKYIYLSLLRAQLSKEELLMLFYNCLSDYGNEKFKPLVEKYALLKNCRQDSLINPEHANLYEKGAFEFGAQEVETDNGRKFRYLY